MFRSLKVIAAATAIATVLTGVAYAATRPVPENQPKTTVQNSTATALPGDAKALEQILQKAGPVNYKILVVDGLDGEDRTAYLDRVAEAWGQPGTDQLLLVIYADGNYDIRFYMGAIFRQHDVSVDEMLGLVRTLYLPKARTGDPSGGLAALIGAVNRLMSTFPSQEGGNRRVGGETNKYTISGFGGNRSK